MTKNLELPSEGYYSPQQLSTRLFQLDLQVANLAAMVKRLYQEVHGDHKHINDIDVMLLDLQNQIHACRALHDKDIEGAPI
jgi:hypothetical protein